MIRLRAFSAVLALCMGMIFTIPAYAQTNVLLIVDGSGSMKKAVGNETRMDVAKKVLAETLTSMPADAQIGLLLYGHRKAKDCNDMELVAPIGGEDAAAINKMIQDIKPIGETPIADSLKKAAKSFKAFKGQQNSIILVTDGVEECKGDPCAAAKELKDAGLDVAVNIVGFTLGEEEGKALQCVTEITGGKYYAANDAAALTTALQDVQKKVQETVVVQTAKAPEFDGNILAPQNGGTLIYAPSDKWAALNTEKFEGPTYEGEAVWGFKDGKPATFRQIELLVKEENVHNIGVFEVLAGDDINGPFRSLGEFKPLNTKVQPEGWQGFAFPETKAKFVKVVIKQSQAVGEYTRGNPMRLIGTIDESAPAEEQPVLTGDDILSVKNGGTLVYAPSDKWATINTDKFEGPTYEGEAVWSFRDGKPATFDRIEVLVNEANVHNIGKFEVLAGDSPEGPFKSVGEFTVKNHKLMPDGWQRFTFPATTARYVKIAIKQSQAVGEYTSGNLIRIFGKVDDAAAAAEKPALTGDDILSVKNGGTLVYAPSDKWATINTDKFEGPTYEGEAVWSFRNGKPATFDRIEVLVNEANVHNIGKFELLAGDSPDGPFKSVGEFTVKNHKLMPDGWQRFTFPATTARYVKIAIKQSQAVGEYTSGNLIRIFGKVDDTAPAAEKPAAIEGTNLLAQSAGGSLLMSKNDEWAKLNDGKEERATTYDGESVWAFNGEKPAIIEAVDIYLPGADQYNVKEFEVLVGDEGPTGNFKSVGTFTTKNTKVAPDGYQRFTFPKAQAKYVKITLKTDHGGGYIAAYEFRVIGKLAE